MPTATTSKQMANRAPLVFCLLAFMGLAHFGNVNNIKAIKSWVLVAHAYNPISSGGRDKEYRSLR
jgi:hypothetical protein